MQMQDHKRELGVTPLGVQNQLVPDDFGLDI